MSHGDGNKNKGNGIYLVLVTWVHTLAKGHQTDLYILLSVMIYLQNLKANREKPW